MTFSERLQQVIDELDGGNVSAFSRSCGVSNSTISAYLDGTNIPKIDKVAIIAEKKQISLDWLVLGRGQMRIVDLQDREQQTGYAVNDPLAMLEDHLPNDPGPHALDKRVTEDNTNKFMRMSESSRKVDRALHLLGWKSPRIIEDLFITLTFIYNIEDAHIAESLSTIRSVCEDYRRSN